VIKRDHQKGKILSNGQDMFGGGPPPARIDNSEGKKGPVSTGPFCFAAHAAAARAKSSFNVRGAM